MAGKIPEPESDHSYDRVNLEFRVITGVRNCSGLNKCKKRFVILMLWQIR